MKKHNLIIAAGFFVFWMLALFLIADYPPPPGFIWIIPLVAFCAFVVYLRVNSYKQWSTSRRKGRFFLALLDGLAAGLVLAFLMVLKGPGQGGIKPQLFDYVFLFFIMSFLGMFNSSIVFAISAAIIKKQKD